MSKRPLFGKSGDQGPSLKVPPRVASLVLRLRLFLFFPFKTFLHSILSTKKKTDLMKDITVQELKTKLDKQEDFLLIDVREPSEHEEFNVGGDLIPMGNFPGVLSDLFPQREKEIVLYCRSGRRSGIIKNIMVQAGFPNVRNLEGGMLAWKDAFKE